MAQPSIDTPAARTVGPVAWDSWDAASPARSLAPRRVLVVEDDEALSAAISAKLQLNGLVTAEAPSAEIAVRMLAETDFDLLLLDVGLPGASGLEICRSVRRYSDIPVIFLTAAIAVPERLAGFDAGGDDYIVKPASLHEVVRRVWAVLRRRPALRSPTQARLLGPGGLVVDRIGHQASLGERPLDLTTTEFSLLALLLERRGEVLGVDAIAHRLWGHETFGDRNFVEQHVSRLRGKMRDAGAGHLIVTVRSVGYTIR